MSGAVSLLTGVIFYEVGETSAANHSNLQSQFGAIIVIVSTTLLATGQATLMTFPSERPIFIREYNTGHYSVFSYFCSRLAVESTLAAIQISVSVSSLTMNYSQFM